MTVFADGFVASRACPELDAFCAELPDWDLRGTPLGRAGCEARVEIASTAGLQLLRGRFSGPMMVIGAGPVGTCQVSFLLDARGELHSRGRRVAPATTAPARMAGDANHFVAGGAWEVVTIVLGQASFDAHLRDRFGRESRTLGNDWWLRTAAGGSDCAARGRAILALQSLLTGGVAASPAARRRLEDCVLQVAFEDFDADGTAKGEPTSLRRRSARHIEEILRECVADPPSLIELCRIAKVSERTLHKAFQESFGMPPKAYLRAMRLDAARRRLSRGEGPVTTVAADLGLFHFGRFAVQYRTMFGEPPSETLRRATGQASHR